MEVLKLAIEVSNNDMEAVVAGAKKAEDAESFTAKFKCSSCTTTWTKKVKNEAEANNVNHCPNYMGTANARLDRVTRVIQGEASNKICLRGTSADIIWWRV